ncbi:MAG: hypothetical protein PHR28_09905 [candidate division Zixibacteria bacterium]|nr:hypothetical protein [candidate division Zixibacteria bacterium]
MKSDEVTLLVNGHAVELNQFAGAIIGNVVLGMVQSLHLNEFPEVVELKVTKTQSTERP